MRGRQRRAESGSLTSYAYDAFGDLLTVVDPASNTVANNSYDIRGRRTTSIDADMGTWTYVYDGFGELSSQTDAKSQVSTLTYDALGRVLTHSEVGFASSYVYDTAAGKGVGQPASAASTAAPTIWGAFTWGAANWLGPAGYGRSFGYDGLGRPSTLTLTEDGAAGAYALTYDANGRVQTVTYPSGFTALYAYTALGYLQQISDNALGTVYWTANTRDAELHLLTQTQGNGVTTTEAFNVKTGLVESTLAGASNAISNQTFTFDTLGRLTARAWLNNAGASVKENSCFDGLNRLTGTRVGTGTACTGTGAVAIAYDALGNITEKTDVCAAAGCFVYGGPGAGPHALTSIVGTYNGVTNPTFTYDANGVMTAGAGRTVTATSFNMAATITDGANTAAFGYDPEHARYRMVTTGLNAGTTYYLNDPSSGAMEEESIVSGATTWRDYIMADGKLVAQRMCAGAAPCTASPQIDYFVLDHLGSVAIIVDATGAVLNRLSYDAWGKRRNPDGTALSCTAGLSPPSSVTRGFTGQEMLDDVCLINFNARIYDPTLGRFMAADPVVGDETVPQELNRYTYVLNDPLSLTDPSGLCGFWCVFDQFFAIVVGIVLENPGVTDFIDGALGLSGPALDLSTAELGLLNAGIDGGITGLIASGGSLKGAALGVLQGGLFDIAGNALKAAGTQGFFGIGHAASAFIAHGLVGGLVSEIGQGRFGSGFLAGGISSFTPVPTGGQLWEKTFDGAVESAVLGGVGSVLGGGKFENGAITGAFAYLFNDAAHANSGCGGHANCPVTDQQRAAAQAQAGPFFITTGGVAAFLFGGEIIDSAVGVWDLLVGGGEATEEAAAAADAGDAAVDANKLNHIFGNTAHNLEPLVQQYGSQEGAYNAINQAVTGQLGTGSGTYSTVVNVGGTNVNVTGAFVNGVARIGTAYVPK